MNRVAIIAALPGELKPLVKGWPHTKQDGVDLWQRKSGQGAWLAACAGMGADAATRAFAAIEREGAIDLVLSYGWVGALNEQAAAGSAAWPVGVVDARTGERFPAIDNATDKGKTPTDKGKTATVPEAYWQVTVPYVANGQQKQQLAQRYNAGFVDMEAATVARLAAMRDLPFYLCRGVSDGAHDVLPDFNRFRGPRGEFQMAKFVAYAAIHPQYWPALARMGENSKKAAVAMAQEARIFLGKPEDKST